MSRQRFGVLKVAAAAAVGFLAGAITVAVALRGSSIAAPPTVLSTQPVVGVPVDPQPALPSVPEEERPALVEGRANPLADQPQQAPAAMPSAPAAPFQSSTTTQPTTDDQIVDLRNRHLEIPVRGILRRALRDSFVETRDTTRTHEAMDILAARNTEIIAVEDGVIARLFESKQGGTTVYQFDPTMTYTYYYGHLERYADGLREGQRVQRGQVLGYVGTSGNAPKNTPHLHFGIFRLAEGKKWWSGSPLNPFLVFRE